MNIEKRNAKKTSRSVERLRLQKNKKHLVQVAASHELFFDFIQAKGILIDIYVPGW